MSAISPFSSFAAPFMFSYNCLSCSSWPAVPSPFSRFGGQLVDPAGQRVEAIVQLLLGQQLAGGSLAALQARGNLIELLPVAVSDFASCSSFSSLPRLPSPALIRRVISCRLASAAFARR